MGEFGRSGMATLTSGQMGLESMIKSGTCIYTILQKDQNILKTVVFSYKVHLR